MTTDRHPEELLAGYAEGALTDRERATVEAHLAGCERCREESALAMRGLEQLRALPEEPVPLGVMNPVSAELAHRMARPARRPLSQRVLWAAGGAVAATFVAVVALSVLPHIGGEMSAGGGGAQPAAAGAQPSPTAGAGGQMETDQGARVTVPLERSSTNYDDQRLAALAVDTARSTPKTALAGESASAPDTGVATAAERCLARGSDVQPQDRLVRLIQAGYAGRPALIGVYLTGPAPGQPATGVLVWVVSSEDCSLLSFTSKRL